MKGNDTHTQKIKTLKSCFNTFQPVDKAFIFSHSVILISFVHSKQIISSQNFYRIPAVMVRLEEDLCFKTIQNKSSKQVFYHHETTQ